jgi:hypothetical protein
MKSVLYALSCYDDFAACLVRDIYARYQRRIAAIIAAARPNFSCRLPERSQAQTIACATTLQKTASGFTPDPND